MKTPPPRTPPRIAVVGHTNTGKTSLLRTLLRDAAFGDVSDRPATTRHSEAAELSVESSSLILTDTPGLEDSSGLLEYLESITLEQGGDQHERIVRWLADHQGHFSQEAKAVRQVLECDVAIYVIDARERMLGRHRDELTVLSWCARPLVPVLNFVASAEVDVPSWRDQLARLGLHAVVAFDTVIVEESSERQLLEVLRTLVPKHEATFDGFMLGRSRQRVELVRASALLIADMLIDAAACVLHVDPKNEESLRHGVETLRTALRAREQRCAEQLMALHRFRGEDRIDDDLPGVDGRWGLDLFHPAAVKQFGAATGRGAAVGAMAGLAIDALVGGMTLGAAAATGAGVGALFETARGHGRRWLRRARGETELRADDSTIHLLALRAISLARALLGRGHAAQAPVRVAHDSLLGRVRTAARTASGWSMPKPLQSARLSRRWSSLGTDGASAADPRRAEAVFEVSRLVTERLVKRANEPTQFP
ncbi:MAG: GTPase/DUF3482 domain-containing protein [Phycisphaerae bacterium]|nr:GTPase/DUF3482 domain-containing protein [Phycisphaerae bacterium]